MSAQGAQVAPWSLALLPVCFLNYNRRILNSYEVFKTQPGPSYGESIPYALSDLCGLNLVSFLLSLPSSEMGTNGTVLSLFIP